jgi:glutamate dehydrogenase (NADP+)
MAGQPWPCAGEPRLPCAIQQHFGPCKGGLRFHPSVTLSILNFLGFEQTFKSSLTTLPRGSAKGGADFNPKGKSDWEVMRFCQSFMCGLWKYIGKDTDIPAGDIGVGGREIRYLFGEYKRLANEFTGTITGKGLTFGGSLIRTEATGYGCVYFCSEMLKVKGDGLKGKVYLVSGSGNVAQYTVEKATQLGAKVVTMSDSDGFIYDADGIDAEKLAYLMNLKNVRRGRIAEYAQKYQGEYHEGKRPWGVRADIAFPSATQNEIDENDAREMIKNGVMAVCEGANMPTTLAATKLFQEHKVLFSPRKASNAGGVAVSGLEQTQNALRLSWTREEVDAKLQEIMRSIHSTCVNYGKNGGHVNYVKGANIGGFVKVAEATLAYGII